MAALLLILPQIIAMIPSATAAVGAIIRFVAEIRNAAKQSGEWTPELERQFIDSLISRTTDPAWQPDPK